MKTMQTFKTTISLILLCGLLSACGFSLRGTESLALNPEIEQLSIKDEGNNSALGQLLTQRLQVYGLDLLEPGKASLRLTLGAEQVKERVVSINRNARAGEFEMTLITSIELSKDADVLISREVLALEEIYEADPANLAAKANEAELIKTEMRQELVEQILRRLQAL